MKHTLRLTDYRKEEIKEIFHIADDLQEGKYKGFLAGKTIVMFFQNSSLRTRITFERGIYLLGGQAILFPPETLDKKEKIEDVVKHLSNWVEGAIIRHKSITLLEEFSNYAEFPVINAMTDCNHPCEMLSDLYALSKIRSDFTKDKFLFVGAKGNIGLVLKEAADSMGFSLIQSCPAGYELEGVEVIHDLKEAVQNIDVICTDSIPQDAFKDFENYKITLDIIKLANKHCIFNPCPPFYRGEEVSDEVIESSHFAGYEFKKNLLEVQQAIIIFSMTH
jgi:ornithine carbamoyltransferase